MAAGLPAQAQPAPHANQYGLGLIGAPAAWAQGYTYAGLRVQNFHQHSYWETTEIGLFFPAQDFTSVASSLGLETSALFAVGTVTLRPVASAAWLHDLRDGALVTRAALFDAPFEIDAAAPGRDAAEVSFELSASWTDSFSLFAGYGGEFRRNATSHEVRGGFSVAL
jgi:uncharacterized protein with beta-barrel porin domain